MKSITKLINITWVLIIISGYCSEIAAKGSLGVDLSFSKINFKENFGDNIFSNKFSPGLHVFTNYMFQDFIGGQLGVEVYKQINHIEKYIPGNTMVAGVKIPNINGYSESYKTTLKRKNVYVGVISRYDFTRNIFLNVLVGVSLSNIKAKKIVFSLHHTQRGDWPMNNVRTFSKTILTPMLKASIGHKFNDNVSIGISVGWQQTSLFNIKSKEQPCSPTCIKAKDSFIFGIGLMYCFF